MLEPA